MVYMYVSANCLAWCTVLFDFARFCALLDDRARLSKNGSKAMHIYTRNFVHQALERCVVQQVRERVWELICAARSRREMLRDRCRAHMR